MVAVHGDRISIHSVWRAAVAALVAVATLFACAVVSAPQAYAVERDLSQYIDKDNTVVSVSKDNGSTWVPYSEDMSVSYNDKIRVSLHWKFPNAIRVKSGDTFTYKLPHGLKLNEGKKYDLYNNGAVDGNFVINGDTLTVTYTKDEGQDVSGFATVDANIDQSADPDGTGGKKSFEFPGYGTLTFNLPATASVSASKSNAKTVPGNPDKFDFIVTVTSKGKTSGVTLDDSMGELLTIDETTPVMVYTDANCTQPYTGKVTVTGNTAGSRAFTTVIDNMNNGQTLYVKYRVNADRDKIYDSTTSDSNDTAGKRTNTVSYSWNGNTNKQTTSNKIDINNTWSVDKTGNYDKSSKTVTWTVVLRPGDSGDISGAKLKDALGKGLESPSGNITMDYYDEEWWNNPDQHKGSVSVPWSQVADGSYTVPSSAAGHKRYVLTYTTKVDNPPSDDQDAKTYDNTFTITPAHPANSNGQSATGNVTIGNTQPKATVSKQFSSASAQADGRTKLTWKTTVTANRDLTNPQFVDVLSANSNTGTHSFDCSNIGEELTVSMQGAGSTPQYTVSSCEAGKVVLDFGSTIPAGATMTIAYSTYASADTPKGTTETNTATFAGISASANYTIPKKEQPTLSKAFVYYPDSNPSAGRLPWSLKVSNIDASAKKVTITDTLPQGLKYVPNSVKLSNCTGQGGDVQQCVADNISVAANGNTLVFTLKNPSIASGNNSVTITYTTTYSDFAAAAKQNTEYVNTAYLTVDGTQYAPVSANVWAQLSSLVSKTADYTEETAPYANYTIDVNPAAIPLNDGNKLELDDTIPDSLALDVTSVKIASESGSDLPGASYTYNPTTRLLTVTVPDSTHAKVTYRARVLLKPGSQMNVDNTAVLRGYSDGGGKGTKSLNGSVYQAKGGTTSDRFALSIYKYADGDASHALPDAVFGIYKLEVSNGKTTKQTLTDTEITDKNGTVAYGALLPNTVYKISETKAPTGYQTADPLYIVFPDTKDDISKYQNQTVDGHQLIVAATSDGVALQTYSWDCTDKETPRSYPVTVSKVDATDSKTKLKGARLQLVRMDNGTEGTVADEWTTDGSNDHEVKLTSSGEYRLKEVSAPQGYDLAAPIDFTVNSDGTIVHNGKSVSAIVMTDTPKTTSVKATKVWNDNNNQDGKRTDATFSLYRKVGDGAESKVSGKDKTVLANATGDALTVQWTGLPQYENGKPVTYSVKESTANTNGYKTTVEGDSSSGYTFTNTYTPQTTAISVHKVWEDSDNQDGIRPNNVHVELYANGVATGRTATITGANNWTVTFSGLPVYDSGKAIAYSVREQAINGYTTKISGTAANGYTITNSHTPQTVTIQGAKTWNDDNNLTGSRPKSITIDLYADGKKVDSRVATASGSWRWDFGEQPACKAGAQITYTVAEEPVPGYTAQIDGYNVTNTVTKHEVKLLKTDESGNPVAGAVMHVATASGTQVGASWTSGAQATPMQLAAGDYQLVEDAAPAGYQLATSPVAFTVNVDGTVSVNGAKVDAATVTMSDKLDTIDITGVKQWNDNNNHDGLRPDSVTVKLLANGQPATDTAGKQRTAAVTANDNWKFSFTKLPRVDASGKTIAYSVEEQPVAGYTSAVSGDATSGFTITNTHANETVDISGVKQWKNDTEATRPQSVTLQLYANGTPMLGDDGKPVTATASASDNWKYAFTGLPKYNKGTAVNYTVVETSSPKDYVAEAGTADNGYAVTNTYAPGKRSLTVTKQWVDAAGSADSANRPDSIRVQLYADGAATGSPVKLDADNGWAYTWTDLDAKKSGKSVVYTVKETQVPDGYTDSTSTSDDGNVVTLTNTARRYAVTIAKTDGNSPLAGAKLQITDVNGVPVSGSFTSGDSATVHNLYPGDYLLTELQAPEGYQIADPIAFHIAANGAVTFTGADGSKKTANNGTLTMVDKSQTTSITGKKVWNDDADQAGKRPSAITVDLLANGKAATKNGKPVTASVSAETGWAFSFDDLPVIANGSAVTYTVKEEQVTGYTADISGDAANGFTITNTIDRHTVKLAKTDENGAALAGATMRLTDPNGVDVVQPWISGGQPYETELADGSYVLTEAQAPAHYDIAESIPFKVSGGKVIIGGEEQDQATVTMRDERSRFQVNIDKVNVAGTRVEGAVLEVTTSDGKTTLAQWTTDGENAHALTLEPGDYRLVETQAPASGMYASIDPINFSVGDDGTLTVTDSDGTRTLGGNTITAVDKYASHKVTVSKKSLTEGIGEIAGAQLEISGVNLDGESVEDQWTSRQGKDHSTELKPGSYTLRETAAPAGYTVADPIDFTVTTGGALEINGERQYGRTLEMVDEPATTPVTLSKVGSDNVSRELAGASLTVTGTTFEGASYKHTWTSKGDGPLVLQLPNGTYTMSETKAPEGYEPADPIDFTVNAGVVTINGQPMSDDTVQMQDTAVSKTAVTAIKQWSDDNNRDGKRAASVKMVLKANGKTATTGNGLVSDADSVRTLSAANNWSTTWSGLTQTDAKGKTIRYTVEEITFDSANYHESMRSVPQSDGVRIYVTNIHQPDTVAISGTKVWNDNDNADGVRPDHIDVVLYGNGSPMVTTAITPDANGNWKWTFEGMPKNDSNGKPIVYTMAEKPVDGYTSSVGGDAKRGFTITNTRSQNTTDITVNKVWNDDDDTAQLRPDAIRVQLYANGRQVGRSVRLTAKDGWVHTWTALPVNIDGQPVVYTVKELGRVEGYAKPDITDTANGGFTITNTIERHTVKLNKADALDDSVRLDGATLAVTTMDGKSVKDADGSDLTWVTDADKPREASLSPGDYLLHEIKAPEGYQLTGDVYFQVKDDGTIDAPTAGSDGVVLISDLKSTVPPVIPPVTPPITPPVTPPTTPPTTPPSTPPTITPPTPGTTTTSTQRQEQRLAQTGTAIILTVVSAALLAMCGTMLMVLRRRREGDATRHGHAQTSRRQA